MTLPDDYVPRFSEGDVGHAIGLPVIGGREQGDRDDECNGDFAIINSKGQNANMNKQVAQAKYFVAMAYDVDNVRQSDYLYFIKFRSGRVAGFAGEFETFTYDIEDACSAERNHLAKWFCLPGEEWQWTPATLEEIKSLGLEKCVIGSKKDMKVRTPIDPVGGFDGR